MQGMATARMTVDEYFAWCGDREPDGSELVLGEIVMEEPSFRHQITAGNIFAELRAWTRAAPGRGTAILPIDTYLQEDTVVGPDVQWYAEGRELGDPTTRPKPLGDIVVEVRSPSTWLVDREVKGPLYEEHGARELWLVDDDAQTITVHRRSAPGRSDFDVVLALEPGDTLTSPELPGFAVAVAELLA